MTMLRFGEVEAALRLVHRVSAEKAAQFRARLRNLKRAGLDLGSSGPGRKANLTIADALQLALAIEFGKLGNTPERTVLILSKIDDMVRDGVVRTFAEAAWDNHIVLSLFLDAWQGMSDETIEHAEVYCWSTKQLQDEVLTTLLTQSAQLGLINISSVIINLLSNLGEAHNASSLQDELVAWARSGWEAD